MTTGEVEIEIRQALDGELVTKLKVDMNQKAADIKVALEGPSQTPAKYQKLCLDGGEVIEDHQTLSSVGFAVGGHLVVAYLPAEKLDFVLAVRDGINDVNLLRYMLATGADVNGKVDGEGRPPDLNDGIEEAQDKHLMSVAMKEASALHHAANHGHSAVCGLILESKEPLFTEINSLTQPTPGKWDDPLNMSALHVAALNGHDQVCCMILSDKTFNLINETIDEPNSSRDALALACQKGLPRTVEMLLSDSRCTGIDRDIDSYDTTLLMLACCNNTPGNIEICKMIINDSRFTKYDWESCRGAGTKLSGTAGGIAKANGLEEIVKMLDSRSK